MKHLKLIIFAFIILQTTFTFSQQILGCDDEPAIDEQVDESIYTNALSRNTQDTNKYVFNMFFHIIRNSNGDAVPTNENTTLEAIAMLNRTYNQFDIYFKYLGFDYLDDNDFTDVTSTEFYSDLNNTSQTRPDAFNVYIAHTVNGGNNAGKGRFNNTFSVFDDDYFLTASLPHEIGHNFYVLHTHQGSTGACEHVNRDNCLTNGDKICDTEASYLFTQTNVHNIGADQYEYVNPNNDTDCIGDIYVNVPIRNFMSRNLLYVNNYYNNLRNHFTQGQGIRARETIEDNPNNHFSDAQTTIASLFRPYKEEFNLSTPVIVSTTELRDGIETCTIQYLESFIHYFQPGFDYNFYLSNGTTIEHSHTLDELYSIQDDGLMRGIKIGQIDTSNIEPDEFGYQGISVDGVVNYIQMCYKPAKNCTLDPFLRGQVLSSDNLANQNNNIKILNSQETKDPDLEQNLENGKFHIINKTTNNGVTTQKTIYKDDN